MGNSTNKLQVSVCQVHPEFWDRKHLEPEVTDVFGVEAPKLGYLEYEPQQGPVAMWQYKSTSPGMAEYDDSLHL